MLPKVFASVSVGTVGNLVSHDPEDCSRRLPGSSTTALGKNARSRTPLSAWLGRAFKLRGGPPEKRAALDYLL